MEALRRSGCEFAIAPGDGAFYGPKIEYTLKDALGRQWQCGTMQVDFNTAERLGGEYVDRDQRPRLPGDAAPGDRRQLRALHRHPDRTPCRRAAGLAGAACRRASSISPKTQADYAREVAKSLQKQGLRVASDLRNEKITYKIREHSLQKVPYILVVGDKEKANGAVAVRARGNHDLGVMPLDDFARKLAADIAQKL